VGVAPEAAACPVLPAAPETTSAVVRTEGVMAKGPSDAVAVAVGTSRELSLALTSKSYHPPVRDEPPLRWVSPWDSLSELFTLDDAAEGMEREKLGEGFTAVLCNTRGVCY